MSGSVALAPRAVVVRDFNHAQSLDWSKATTWDYETSGLQWWKDEPYALAVLIEGIPHVCLGDALALAMTRMAQTIEDSSRYLIAYNAKFELHFTSREMLNVRANVIDPSLALFLLDENKFSGTGHGLKHAVKEVFGYQMRDFDTMLGTVTYETGEYKTRKCSLCKGKGWQGRDHSQCERCAGVGMEARPVTRTRKRNINEVNDDDLAAYAGDDVYWTQKLWEWASAKLAANPDLQRYFDEVATPMLATLYAGEHKGIRIDLPLVEATRTKYLERISAIDAEILARTGVEIGTEVNLDSPQQVDNFLYRTLGLKRPPFRTKRKASDGERVTSKWQTDENCLLWLSKHSATDIPKLLWERRKCSKYVGTYLDNMVEEAVLESEGVWVLYPNFNMTVARTGRLSSSGVLNFQNIPHSDEFRRLFIARPGYVFVIADAKQIELRFLAHFSNDPALVGPYSDPSRDLHQETADFLELSGKEGRYVAKTFNFAEVYEVYGNTASMQLFRDTEGAIDWTKEQAQAVLDKLRDGRPLVKRWKKNLVTFIQQNGYSPTIENRRRRLPEIASSAWAVKKYAERQGINSRIQGSVGDGFGRVLSEQWISGPFRLQVHDEVVLEATVEEAQAIAGMATLAIESLTERYKLRVPILAEVSIGTDWSAK